MTSLRNHRPGALARVRARRKATYALLACSTLAVILLPAPAGAAAVNAKVTGADTVGSTRSMPLPTDAKPAVAKLESCSRSPKIARRSMGVYVAMHSMSGAKTPQIRVKVIERYPGSNGPITLQSAVLNTWIPLSSSATIGIRHVVVSSIDTRARFYAIVSFRWLNSKGHTVARRKVKTGTCRQTYPLPDLRPVQLLSVPSGGGTNTFHFQVVNGGGSQAAPWVATAYDGPNYLFTLAWAVPQSAGQTADITLPAFTCQQKLTIVVDSAFNVRESDETNNTFSQACSP